MWPRTFADRLESWSNLRQHCSMLDKTSALTAVNSWWFNAPWTAYHLHWDDRLVWPDPWQLLDDNIYCGLARGLGIMYTIAMIEHPEMQDAVLVETGSDNLVQVGKRKYILNWDEDLVLNTIPEVKSKHKVTIAELKKQYNLL